MINIEKLENLPKRLGFIKNIKSSQSYYSWDIGKHVYHPINNYFPYTIVERVLTKFYQKSVNEAFSYYCTLVPKYQQAYFWEQFKTKRYRWEPWYIDENNNIQNDTLKNSEYKGPYTIYSEDYQSELRHKVTGHPRHLFKQVYIHKAFKYEYQWFGWSNAWWKKNPYYTASGDDFEVIITKGYKIDCESKRDSRFQRYVAELKKTNIKQNRLRKKSKKALVYSFLTKEERERKETIQLDLINRNRHGFDEESFKGHPYHGRKNKK